MKAKFWDVKNLLVSLKAIASSLITGLILLIPAILGVWFVRQEMPVVGRLIQFLTLASYLLVWGWVSRRSWGWK